MMATWTPALDVTIILIVGILTTGLTVARATRRRRNIERTMAAAGLTPGPVSGHLLRKRGRIVTWRVALDNGRRSRVYLTQHGAMNFLRRHTRPARPVRHTNRQPRGLQWSRPIIERSDRWN